jgi:hypothetical protein
MIICGLYAKFSLIGGIIPVTTIEKKEKYSKHIDIYLNSFLIGSYSCQLLILLIFVENNIVSHAKEGNRKK